MKSALKQGLNLTLRADFNAVRGTACATAQDSASWSACMTFLRRILSNSREGRDHKGRKRRGQASVSSVMLTHSGSGGQTGREWRLRPWEFGGCCGTLVLVLRLWGCSRVSFPGSQQATETPPSSILCPVDWNTIHPFKPILRGVFSRLLRSDLFLFCSLVALFAAFMKLKRLCVCVACFLYSEATFLERRKWFQVSCFLLLSISCWKGFIKWKREYVNSR